MRRRDRDEPLLNADEILGTLDSMEPFTTMSLGYKARLVEAGYSDPIAEQIAANLLIEINRKAMRGR